MKIFSKILQKNIYENIFLKYRKNICYRKNIYENIFLKTE